MEYLVKVSKRRAFWSLNEDILKIIDSDNQYAVSIKEDTEYPCLHSPKTTKETRSIRRIQRRPIRCIEDIVNLDNLTNNVLISLDSSTSGLLEYKLSLSVYPNDKSTLIHDDSDEEADEAEKEEEPSSSHPNKSDQPPLTCPLSKSYFPISDGNCEEYAQKSWKIRIPDRFYDPGNGGR
ncbi:hypothetical protein Tco_0773999 [Tanacetum coccineum]|uniref:Uncharacterized protein n=1 Tax=Tanacetum coccineum TaxID=301880 RepID=A0ABQ4ZM93_9ASTR